MRSYLGFIALIEKTGTGSLARLAAETIVSMIATRSSFPVESSSRNDWMRDIERSIAAKTNVGDREIAFLDLG
jgi:hypothetical protein